MKSIMGKYYNLVVIVLLSILGLSACGDSKTSKEIASEVVPIPDPFAAEIELKREKMKLVINGNMSPEGSLRTIDNVIISTGDFKGKLLIIDFWAMWCSPCISEAPKFKALEAQYESDQVEFITISIDDSYDFWKDYIIEENWKTDNYWLGSNDSDPFFSYLYEEMDFDGISNVIISLPTYVIIAPDGTIINNKASKPSYPEFEMELKRLIEKYLN